jgi:hypothetical protein
MLHKANVMSRWSGGPSLELTKGLKQGWGYVQTRDVVWWVTAALICIGLVLRARGMWIGRPISLWEDEAAWAMWLVDLPLKEHVLRSIGFMAVTKGLVRLFSESEHVLRSLPWCGGVAALLVTPLLAKTLLRTQGARLLLVAIIALHPAAIDLSKEFKPYSLALLLHMLLLLFVLRYAAKQHENDLLAGVGVAFFGFLFSQDVVFAYPMVFGALALVAYRAKNRAHFALVAMGAGFALVLLLAVRSNLVSKIGNADENIAYWGGQYSVFYLPQHGGTRLEWMLTRLGDLASLPGSRRELWHWSALSTDALASLQRLDSWLWIVGVGAGVVVLIRQKRFLQLTILLVPVLTMVAFNYFGYWPLGAFRTNLFTLVYFGALVAAAVDVVTESTAQSWQALPMGALVLLPFLTIGSSSHASKAVFTAPGPFREAARTLIDMQGQSGQRELLVLDKRSCAPWRYYAHYHPGEPRGRELARRFDDQCHKSHASLFRAVRERVQVPGTRAFMLAAADDEIAALLKRLPSDLRVLDRRVIGENEAILLCVTRATR